MYDPDDEINFSWVRFWRALTVLSLSGMSGVAFVMGITYAPGATLAVCAGLVVVGLSVWTGFAPDGPRMPSPPPPFSEAKEKEWKK